MRLAVENMEVTISQYNQPGYKNSKKIICEILQQTFLMLLEDREEKEISETYLCHSLQKLVTFI